MGGVPAHGLFARLTKSRLTALPHRSSPLRHRGFFALHDLSLNRYDVSRRELAPEKVSEAVGKFLENKQQEGMSKAWNRMLTRELTDLSQWCDTRLVTIATLNKLALGEYRKTWTQGAGTRHGDRNVSRTSSSIAWSTAGYARTSRRRLGRIKVPAAPTLPLTKEQLAAVLYAAQRYNPKSPDAAWRRQRAVAILLVLRWSGLRIFDAAKLACDRLHASESRLAAESFPVGRTALRTGEARSCAITAD